MKQQVNIEALKLLIEKYEVGKVLRKRATVYQRFACYNFIRENTNYSLSEIGLFFNGKDHSSVLHGINMHKTFTRQNDQVYFEYVADIEDELRDCLSDVVEKQVKPLSKLEQRIMDCQNYNEFKTFRAEIRKKLLS